MRLLVFPRVMGDNDGIPVGAVVTNLAYPLVDLGLASAAITAMVALRAWHRPAWLLLAGGYVAFTVADTWYLFLVLAGTFHHGGWNDASYLIAVA